ncbi:MAG TPA: OmpA family protein [Burkholderiaceae bacterium]|nr:OmpA family protein [Burkholderiaceae bacterium]
MLRTALLLALSLAAGSAFAQEVRVYGAGEKVDPQDVARILSHSVPSAPRIKMRSIRLLDDSPAQQAAADAAASSSKEGSAKTDALALPVQFAFDSSNILPTARPQLDALADGIRLLPPNQAVVIEGHTDAKGGEKYNEELSQRRAEAVKRYLVSLHRIDPERLRTVGLGKFVPINSRDPFAPENRRVQFRGE